MEKGNSFKSIMGQKHSNSALQRLVLGRREHPFLFHILLLLLKLSTSFVLFECINSLALTAQDQITTIIIVKVISEKETVSLCELISTARIGRFGITQPRHPLLP